MPTTTGSHQLTYPSEGATGWFSTWETFAQDISDHLDTLAIISVTQINDTNGNEQLKFNTTASAVNYLDFTNAATGGTVALLAAGGDTNVSLSLTPKAAGDLILDGLNWPQADGTANYVLTTDGSAQLSWVSNGVANVVEDTTPQLGGALDVNGMEITGAIDLHSTGDILCELGDASGVNKVSVLDSGAVEVASINSDGDIAGVDVSAATVTTTGLTDANTLSIAAGTAMTAILDEDNMASDSDVGLATQQSIKAYVDAIPGNAWTLITTVTTTSGTSHQVTSGLGTAYEDYLIVFNGVTTSTTSIVDLGLSDDAGSTYLLTIRGLIIIEGQAVAETFETSDLEVSKNASSPFNGYIHLSGNKITNHKPFTMVIDRGSTYSEETLVSAYVSGITDIDAVEFTASAGTFSAGTIKFYGR